MNRTCIARRTNVHKNATVAAAVALSLFVSHAPAARADEKSACVASYDHSQVFRRDHRLARARTELQSCARADCPALVRTDCIAWLDQVQNAIPSLAIRAAKDGEEIATVKVIADEEIIATRLDGSSLEVEPGEHTFRFETEGAPPVVLKLLVHEREKDRVVAVTFASSPEPERAKVETNARRFIRPVPPGMYVLGGVGVAGLAAFGVLGLIGKNDESALVSTCSPNCTPSAIGKVRGEYVGADIGLGVGAAALVSSVIWYVLRPKQPIGAPAPRDGITVAPGRNGAVLAWNATF